MKSHDDLLPYQQREQALAQKRQLHGQAHGDFPPPTGPSKRLLQHGSGLPPIVNDVRCPTCHANPNRPCKGLHAGVFHQTRVNVSNGGAAWPRITRPMSSDTTAAQVRQVGTPGHRSPTPTPTPETSGLAIASMVLGIIGGFVLALIFGHIALRQIDRSNGSLRGKGFAVAGVTLGWVVAAIVGIVLISNGAQAHQAAQAEDRESREWVSEITRSQVDFDEKLGLSDVECDYDAYINNASPIVCVGFDGGFEQRYNVNVVDHPEDPMYPFRLEYEFDASTCGDYLDEAAGVWTSPKTGEQYEATQDDGGWMYFDFAGITHYLSDAQMYGKNCGD